MSFRPKVTAPLLAVGLLSALVAPAGAQSLTDALAAAYANNPTLNAARAQVRIVNENVPQALAGFRPQVSLSASAATQASRVVTRTRRTVETTSDPRQISVELIQPLFTGFRTTNGVKQAEAAVLAQRENLRNTEHGILFEAAQAYMDVIRDTAIVQLRESEIRFLTEQVRAAKDRFQVGEGTRTDVAQAEARLQAAVSGLNAARAQLNASRATFRQVTGIDAKRTAAGTSIDRILPKTQADALTRAQREHPAIRASQHNIDTAIYAVKVAEGELLPTVSVQGSISRNWDTQGSRTIDNAQIGIGVTVPIYQGGGEYSRIRQAKESLGQARIQLDAVRDQVRAVAVDAYGQLQAAIASIQAARAQVAAQELALNGVIEEQKVGQRTTLDVLNAQSELISARANLIQAETSRVVAAYAVARSVGLLDVDKLGLKVAVHDPTEHYNAVRDRLWGTSTPDGR